MATAVRTPLFSATFCATRQRLHLSLNLGQAPTLQPQHYDRGGLHETLVAAASLEVRNSPGLRCDATGSRKIVGGTVGRRIFIGGADRGFPCARASRGYGRRHRGYGRKTLCPRRN